VTFKESEAIAWRPVIRLGRQSLRRCRRGLPANLRCEYADDRDDEDDCDRSDPRARFEDAPDDFTPRQRDSDEHQQQ